MIGRIDWTSNLRVHSDRRNLVIHAFAVLLFVGASAFLIASVVRVEDVFIVISLGLASVAMVLQGRGHLPEPHPPVPFSGAVNFLKPWFTEQFVISPLFVLTGRWRRQFNRVADGSGNAA